VMTVFSPASWTDFLARPCQRCIKRGLQDSCQDGIRKKAKYLQDADGTRRQRSPLTPAPADQQKSNEQPTMPPPMSGSTVNPSFVQNSSAPAKYEAQSYFKDIASDPSLYAFNLSSYNFGSETANLEYSILSNMLNTSGMTPTSDAKTDPHSHPTPPRLTTPTLSVRNTFPDLAMQDIHWSDSHTMGSFPYTTMAAPTSASLTSPSPPAPSPSNPPPTPVTAQPGGSQSQEQQPVKRGPGRPKGRKDTNPRQFHHRSEAGDVYSRVTEPFRYVDGFHDLTKYLRRRFLRQELLRISVAMAKYRPSFIALTKTLKEEDLVFMEKCFQRTLMVYVLRMGLTVGIRKVHFV
jgi:transcription activator of gluconeogenesis